VAKSSTTDCSAFVRLRLRRRHQPGDQATAGIELLRAIAGAPMLLRGSLKLVLDVLGLVARCLPPGVSTHEPGRPVAERAPQLDVDYAAKRVLGEELRSDASSGRLVRHGPRRSAPRPACAGKGGLMRGMPR
jgi:hypothetical protein